MSFAGQNNETSLLFYFKTVTKIDFNLSKFFLNKKNCKIYDYLNDHNIQRIAVIGNIAAGKTVLSKKISEIKNIKNQIKTPVTHVDSIQFDEKLNIKNLNETRKILLEIQQLPAWIIDGHGPLDLLESRFKLADKIIFIDLPIYKNFFWLTYRLIKNIFSGRKELPKGSSELNLNHIKKQYKTTWSIHKKMRPELIRMLFKDEFKDKLIILR